MYAYIHIYACVPWSIYVYILSRFKLNIIVVGSNSSLLISKEKIGHFDLGTAAAVQRRLLLTAEGIALRRLCFEVDAFQVQQLLVKNLSLPVGKQTLKV